MNRLSIFLILNTLFFVPLLQAAKDSPPKGFTSLFDGETLKGWHYLPSDLQPIWKVDPKKGELGRVGRNGAIWTDDTYGDFILQLEFKLSRDCNSGIFVRSDPQNPVQGGFEIQLFDSHGKESMGTHDCGALYDAVAPRVNAVRDSGKWNQIRIRCKGPKIEVTLNGEKIVSADLDRWTTPQQNPDGSKNKFKTSLKDLPRTGHIGFQDHGHNVSFRKVYLKKL